MAEHTPGPWGWARADLLSGVAPHIVQLDHEGNATGLYLIAQVGPYAPLHSVDPDDIRYANARLIAAAPDMLESLARLADECQCIRNPRTGLMVPSGRDHILMQAWAAIAKAKGEKEQRQ